MTPVWTTSRAAGVAALMTASLAISCGLLIALRVPALGAAPPSARRPPGAGQRDLALVGSMRSRCSSSRYCAPAWPACSSPSPPRTARWPPPWGRSPPTACSRWARPSTSAAGIGTQRWRSAHRWLPVFWLLAVAHGLLVGSDYGHGVGAGRARAPRRRRPRPRGRRGGAARLAAAPR